MLFLIHRMVLFGKKHVVLALGFAFALLVDRGNGFSCDDYANGCSTPRYTPYRGVFTPACNLHDVCYRCVSTKPAILHVTHAHT